MITLGLFWTLNKILVWIWRITLCLHFGKPKVPIFVPKWYKSLIFAWKWLYGHRKDCSCTQTMCSNVLTQKYRIMVPKVSVDFVYTIPLLFTQNFFFICFDFEISQVGWNPYPRLVVVPKWNFGFHLKHKIVLHFGKPKVPIFVPKCYITLIFAPKGPYGHKKDYILTRIQCLNVLAQKYRITVPKVSIDFVYTIPLLFTQNFFLTCFDFKISHLGSNDYPRLVLDPKWNFGLDLKHNIVLAFLETKSSYFCSKMIYNTHFCPKRTVWTQKGLLLNRNTVLKCFGIEILYYGSKDLCWHGLYNSFTFYSKLFPHMFWLQNLSFGPNDYPRLVLDPKWNFSLDLNHNIVFAFWETKSTYFWSKKLYCTHFGPEPYRKKKRIVFGPKHST